MKGCILTKALLEKFKEHLILEERSAATIEKYCRDVYAFVAFANGAEITKELSIAYKNKVKDDGYAVRSINSMLSSINSLFAFLGWHDLKVKSIKVQQQIFCSEEKELTKADVESPETAISRNDELTYDQKVFISTIYAEATSTAQGYFVSPIARQAIANVIMKLIYPHLWRILPTYHA